MKKRPAPKIPNRGGLKKCGSCGGSGVIKGTNIDMRCGSCRGTGLR